SSERANLILAHYGYLVNVDTQNLTKEQRLKIVVQQLDATASRYKTAALVVIVIAVLLAIVLVVALFQNAEVARATRRLDERNAQRQEIKTVRDQLQQKHRELGIRHAVFAKGVQDLTASSDSFALGADVVQLKARLQELLRQFEVDFGSDELSSEESLE